MIGAAPLDPLDDAFEGAELCDVCGRESCEDHVSGVDDDRKVPAGLPAEGLEDAVTVAAEGRQIAAAGIRYTVDGIIPNYGMVGMNVAYAKVGKTTFGHAIGAAVASNRPFLDRTVQPARVLCLAIEDPPEYTAYLTPSRHPVRRHDVLSAPTPV